VTNPTFPPALTELDTVATVTKPTRRPRGSLSAEQILDAAQAVVEEEGLAELSMPVLAKRLRSGVTSIYWYFRSKEELLTALADRVAREIYLRLPPIGGGPWDEELIEYFASFRALLEAVPVYREVFAYQSRTVMTRSAMAPSVLRRLDDGLALLVGAGCTPDEAVVAFQALSSYARGFVLLEHGTDPGDPAESPRPDPEKYPVAAQLESLDPLTTLGDEAFRCGVRFMVDGIIQQYGLARPGKRRRTG
jgi:AcrR family transcriptional regulator